MTRRNGVAEPTCRFRVSGEMQRLRAEQTGLNYFLWSSELCFELVPSVDDPRLKAGDELVSKALSGLSTEAWYPNTAGKPKYNAKVSSFLEQLKTNQKMVACATMIMWYTSFEKYLRARLAPLTSPDHWGPFTRSLDIPALTRASKGVQVQTVLRADYCRHLRNLMSHGDEAELPDGVGHRSAREWVSSRLRDRENPREVKDALEYVAGQAANHFKQSEESHKDLPLTFFYTLFAFTNLDALACEIEEALMPPHSKVETTINRQVGKIRRKDLIVSDTELQKGPEQRVRNDA